MKKQQGIELLRIVAASMIVLLHLLSEGGLYANVESGTINMLVVSAIYAIVVTGVNIFALISGYVGYNSKYKPSRIVRLWLSTVFYSVLLKLVYIFIFKCFENYYTWFQAITPIMSSLYWYISAYFMLLLVKPILDKGFEHMRMNLSTLVVVLLLFFTSILAPLFSQNDPLLLNNGYSPLWVIVMYIVGMYIRKFEIHKMISYKVLIIVWFVCVFVAVISPVLMNNINTILDTSMNTKIVTYFNSFIIVVESISILLIFSKIETRSTSKIVEFFSASSLSVYLIHVNPYVFNETISGLMKGFAKDNIFTILLMLLLVTILIVVVCTAIEALRKWIFKLIRIDHLFNNIDNKVKEIVENEKI